MSKEKDCLYSIDLQLDNGRVITPHIAYRRDRFKPWTVDIGDTEVSPAYSKIGFAKAYLWRNYSWKVCPNVKAVHFITKTIFYEEHGVLPCHR